jgi:hypothetical protein
MRLRKELMRLKKNKQANKMTGEHEGRENLPEETKDL